jgi:hypothetical protein
MWLWAEEVERPPPNHHANLGGDCEMPLENRNPTPLEIRSDTDFTWDHWRHGYCQMSHRDAGEKIFIRGSSKREVVAMKHQLRKLARRIHMPLIQIAHAAYAEMLAKHDLTRLDPDHAEFLFEERSDGCVSDNIPTPDDNCDALRAIAAFNRDVEITDSILFGGDPSFDDLLAVSRNGHRWSEFWAVRHPNPKVRARFIAELIEHDKLAEEVRVKAQSMLEKRMNNGHDRQTH